MSELLERLYSNIGRKIKKFAVISFVVLSVISLLCCVIFLFGEDLRPFALPLLFAPVLFYFSSWMMYGFGEIIDRVACIEQNTKKSDVAPEASADQTNYEKIKRLKSLLDRGVITQEEYDEAISSNN